MNIQRTLAAIVPLCLAAGASADVVHFDNHDGTFPWGFYINIGGSEHGEPYLDITQAATQDGSEPFTRAFVLEFRPFFTSGDWSEDRIGGSASRPDMEVAVGAPVHFDHWFYQVHMDLFFDPPQLFQVGDEVGPESTFASYAVRSGTVRTQDGMRPAFRLVPENEDYYVGVRFIFDGETHYGWILMHENQPYEWAYETHANQSIVVGDATCAADFNSDGSLDSQDFFDFLNVFFTSDPRADFNADKAVNSQDFFDFLAGFFAGC